MTGKKRKSVTPRSLSKRSGPALNHPHAAGGDQGSREVGRVQQQHPVHWSVQAMDEQMCQ